MMNTLTSYPVLVGAVGAASAYYLLASSNAPPVQFTPAPVESSAAALDAVVDRVAQNAQKWVDVPFNRKLEYLREMLQIAVQVADQIAGASDKVRGLEGTLFSGMGGIYSVGMTASYLRSIIELYETLSASGTPPAPVSVRVVGSGEVAVVAPRGVWQKVTNPTVVELWSAPGKKLTQAKTLQLHAGVCAVMSPGNFEAPVDVLHQLFLEGRVVVAKSHPLNAASSDVLSAAIFSSLARDGFVALAAGGPEVGARLLQNKQVDSWMMTGGCGTFDAIVWGGKAGKAAGKKQLAKTCHAELGAASPYIVVPGAWNDKEMEEQTTALAGYKMFNSSHICASPQVIVVDRQWPLVKRFSDLLEEKLNTFPAIPAYYTGAQDRLAAIKQNCPSAHVLKANNFHFVPDVDAEGGGGSYMLQNEAFAPALCFKYVDGGNNPAKFLEEAIAVANTKCFGSLSCTLAISPASEKEIGGKQELDLAVQKLRWGTVGINVWAAFATSNAYGVWGAPPGRHTIEDIQSGVGVMGNVLLLDNVDKSVLRGNWCDPMLANMLRPTAKLSPFTDAFVNLQVKQSVGALFGVLKNVLF